MSIHSFTLNPSRDKGRNRTVSPVLQDAVTHHGVGFTLLIEINRRGFRLSAESEAFLGQDFVGKGRAKCKHIISQCKAEAMK